MTRAALALSLCVLLLNPSAWASTPAVSPAAIAFPAIPLPPLPIPPRWPVPFPLPDRAEEAQAHVDRDLPHSSTLLPYRAYATLGELTEALTLLRVLEALRDSDDPAATLDRLEPKLRRPGLADELGRLRLAIRDGDLLPVVRQLEVQIGAARLTPGIPGGGYNPWGLQPDRDALDLLAERLFPRPLAPSVPWGTGLRFNF